MRRKQNVDLQGRMDKQNIGNEIELLYSVEKAVCWTNTEELSKNCKNY